MSFLKKLFGGGEGGKPEAPAAEMEHEGYRIVATPQKEGEQFRIHGTISKEIGGETKSHTLIRADLFPSRDEAVTHTFRKAKLVISEQGDGLFR